jgi:hypothetical protein
MSNNNTGANLGFEDKLWMAADNLRGTMDSATFRIRGVEIWLKSMY